MITVYPSNHGGFQHVPCDKHQVISAWFLTHESEFTVLKRPPVTDYQINRAPSGCEIGDSHYECAAERSIPCYHVNMDVKV